MASTTAVNAEILIERRFFVSTTASTIPVGSFTKFTDLYETILTEISQQQTGRQVETSLGYHVLWKFDVTDGKNASLLTKYSSKMRQQIGTAGLITIYTPAIPLTTATQKSANPYIVMIDMNQLKTGLFPVRVMQNLASAKTASVNIPNAIRTYCQFIVDTLKSSGNLHPRIIAATEVWLGALDTLITANTLNVEDLQTAYRNYVFLHRTAVFKELVCAHERMTVGTTKLTDTMGKSLLNLATLQLNAVNASEDRLKKSQTPIAHMPFDRFASRSLGMAGLESTPATFLTAAALKTFGQETPTDGPARYIPPPPRDNDSIPKLFGVLSLVADYDKAMIESINAAPAKFAEGTPSTSILSEAGDQCAPLKMTMVLPGQTKTSSAPPTSVVTLCNPVPDAEPACNDDGDEGADDNVDVCNLPTPTGVIVEGTPCTTPVGDGDEGEDDTVDVCGEPAQTEVIVEGTPCTVPVGDGDEGEDAGVDVCGDPTPTGVIVEGTPCTVPVGDGDEGEDDKVDVCGPAVSNETIVAEPDCELVIDDGDEGEDGSVELCQPIVCNSKENRTLRHPKASPVFNMTASHLLVDSFFQHVDWRAALVSPSPPGASSSARNHTVVSLDKMDARGYSGSSSATPDDDDDDLEDWGIINADWQHVDMDLPRFGSANQFIAEDWRRKNSGELFDKTEALHGKTAKWLYSQDAMSIDNRTMLKNTLETLYVDMPAFRSTSHAFGRRVLAIRSALDVLQNPISATNIHPSCLDSLRAGALAGANQAEYMMIHSDKRKKRLRLKKKKPSNSGTAGKPRKKGGLSRIRKGVRKGASKIKKGGKAAVGKIKKGGKAAVGKIKKGGKAAVGKIKKTGKAAFEKVKKGGRAVTKRGKAVLGTVKRGGERLARKGRAAFRRKKKPAPGAPALAQPTQEKAGVTGASLAQETLDDEPLLESDDGVIEEVEEDGVTIPLQRRTAIAPRVIQTPTRQTRIPAPVVVYRRTAPVIRSVPTRVATYDYDDYDDYDDQREEEEEEEDVTDGVVEEEEEEAEEMEPETVVDDAGEDTAQLVDEQREEEEEVDDEDVEERVPEETEEESFEDSFDDTDEDMESPRADEYLPLGDVDMTESSDGNRGTNRTPSPVDEEYSYMPLGSESDVNHRFAPPMVQEKKSSSGLLSFFGVL